MSKIGFVIIISLCVILIIIEKNHISKNGNLKFMPSLMRKYHASKLMTYFIKQQRAMSQLREYTAISNQSGTPHLGEMLAALITGVPGNKRKGKSARKRDSEKKTKGDLSDGTEVKTWNRLPSKVDFIIEGIIVQSPVESGDKYKAIKITNAREKYPHLFYKTVQFSITDNSGCTIQNLKRYNGKYIGDDRLILRTRGSNKGRPVIHQIDSDIYLRLKPDSTPTERKDHDRCEEGLLDSLKESGKTLHWRVTKERGQWQTTGRSRYSVFRDFWTSSPILLILYLDPRSRISVAGFRLDPSEEEIMNFEKRYTENGEYKGQKRNVKPEEKRYQPLLFKDHYRTRPEKNDFDGLFNMGAKLMVKGHQTENNSFKFDFWDPKGGKGLKEVVGDLTSFAHEKECPSIKFDNEDPFKILSEGWADKNTRFDLAITVFNDHGSNYLKRMLPYCNLTNSPNNIGIFAELSEHLCSLISGMKGTRSGSKGADLVENTNGFVPSEVKSCVGNTGQVGWREDKSVYDLIDFNGHKNGTKKRLEMIEKLLSWRRIFFVRWIYFEELGELRCAIHLVEPNEMSVFHEHVIRYGWNTMFQYGCLPTALTHSKITGDLVKKRDGLRQLKTSLVCTFKNNSIKDVKMNLAIETPPPCKCKWCNIP